MLRILSWFIVLAAHAHDAQEPTDKLVPPGWQGNPWGPAATRARARGEIPPLPLTTAMKKWDDWGRQVLREGDILFRQGNAKLLFGYFPFSRFIAQASNSAFSHTGIVAIEEGAPVVYDTTKAGVRRQPFYIWVLDNVGPLGVKRLKPPYRDRIPGVIAYCRRVFEAQVPFDYELGLDDQALYCVEMTEKAFRAAGLKLSEPIRLGDMENAARMPIRVLAFQYLSSWTLPQPLSLEQPAFFPGNERHGIWSSPLLQTVYAPPRTDTEGTTAETSASGTDQARVRR
ncbi:MAG: hypothetical protein IRY99_11285 [Isosphaeraceae bacterium]|nr:hypothetical protein [Isosphaeraceae bacterium]